MKALVYTGKDKLEIKEQPDPRPEPGEALIRVKTAGICGSDLSILAGKHPRAEAPLIMGHEFCGEIAELNSSGPANFAVGDRVTAEPLISCGICRACRSGFSHVCENLKLYGIDADGAFAQYMRMPISKLYRLPESIGDNLGALIEPLAVAVHATRLSGVNLDDTVCVLGGGPIGLLIALLNRSIGNRVLVCERDPFRLGIAEQLGLEVIDVQRHDPVEAVLNSTGGSGADVVFEAAGAPQTVLAAPRVCRVKGLVMAVAMPKDPVPYDIVALTFKEITVKGVRVYASFDFERAVHLADSSGIDFGKLQSAPFTLDQGCEAFALAKTGWDVMRVLIGID